MPYKKKYGQHFLHEASVLERIVSSACLSPDDHVLEIGPGAGALTAYLIPRVQRLIAVEIDRDLMASLKLRFEKYPGFELINNDILKYPWSELVKDKPLRLISNLPYQITSPLLYKCMHEPEVIQDMILMLQADVINRMLASPGTKIYGSLSVVCQFYYQMERVCKVSRGCFTPPPRVESAVIKLSRRVDHTCVNVEWLRCIVKKAFMKRRKTLNNALKPWFKTDVYGIDGKRRPETLSVDEYVKLSNASIELSDSIIKGTAGGGN